MSASIEYNFDACSEDVQYTLYRDGETVIRFSTAVNDIPCVVHLTFKPFRRRCNLIFHEYEVHCFIPFGTSIEAVSQSKHSIIAEAHRLYDKCFSANAGYKLTILQTEVGVSWELDRGRGNVSNPVPHEVVRRSGEERPSKRQKARHTGDIPPPDRMFAQWTGNITIHKVQATYQLAIRDGRLKCQRVPQLESKSDTRSSQVQRWDPYILTASSVPRALLDTKKVEGIAERVRSLTRIVPEAVEWMARSKEYGLTPEDLQSILRTAFVSSESFPTPQEGDVSKLPAILATVAKLLSLADELKNKSITLRRAEAILRMVAYASMEVSVIAGEATDDQVEAWMSPLVDGGRDWLRRCRNFARFWCWAMASLPGWKGRDLALYLILVDKQGEAPLRALFQPVFPAGAGEFVSMLSSEVYWRGLPVSTTFPGVVEIVTALLDGIVKNELICYALGCPDSYLSGFDLSRLAGYTSSRAVTLFRRAVTPKRLEMQETLLEAAVNDEPCCAPRDIWGGSSKDKQDGGLNANPLHDDEFSAENYFGDLFCTSYTIPPSPPC